MKFPLKATISTTIIAAVSLCIPLKAQAYLGGFELGDGYGISGQVFLAPSEVAKYNAGQYGTNNGGPGGVAMLIPDGSGRWSSSNTFRSPIKTIAGQNAYATAHQFYDRTYISTGRPPALATDQALVLTTNVEGWDGPTLKYGYKLDERDLDGWDPNMTAGKTINLTFWWCPNIFGPDEGGGLGAGTIGDTIELVDSAGNVGFTVGLVQPATSTDYVGYDNGSGFTRTDIIGYNFGYSKWDLTLDLTNQKISASYLDGAPGGVLHTVLTNAPLAAHMNNFTKLLFASTPGVTNQKLLALDDFNFTVPQHLTQVPEPDAKWMFSLLGISGVFQLLRRHQGRSKTD